MKTPDEEVADKIMEKFREAKLLSEKGINKLMLGLSSGKLSSVDWKLAFETDRHEAEEDNANHS